MGCSGPNRVGLVTYDSGCRTDRNPNILDRSGSPRIYFLKDKRAQTFCAVAPFLRQHGKTNRRCAIVSFPDTCARVAQWIRAFASGAKGRRFNPCRGYTFLSLISAFMSAFKLSRLLSKTEREIGPHPLTLPSLSISLLTKSAKTLFGKLQPENP